MATYKAIWTVEFEADSDEAAREEHAWLIAQSAEVDARISVTSLLGPRSGMTDRSRR